MNATRDFVRTRLLKRVDKPGTRVCDRHATCHGELLAQWDWYAWVRWDGETTPDTRLTTDTWVKE